MQSARHREVGGGSGGVDAAESGAAGSHSDGFGRGGRARTVDARCCQQVSRGRVAVATLVAVAVAVAVLQQAADPGDATTGSESGGVAAPTHQDRGLVRDAGSTSTAPRGMRTPSAPSTRQLPDVAPIRFHTPGATVPAEAIATGAAGVRDGSSAVPAAAKPASSLGGTTAAGLRGTAATGGGGHDRGQSRTAHHPAGAGEGQEGTIAPWQPQFAEPLLERLGQVNGVFGVPELVTRADVRARFTPDPRYAPLALAADEEVRDLYHAKQAEGLASLRRVDMKQGAIEEMRSQCRSIDDKFREQAEAAAAYAAAHGGAWRMVNVTMPELYARYDWYDTRDCPVTTPECLVFLDPQFCTADADGHKWFRSCYRKCCVEHRRLRDVALWTFTVLKDAGIDATLTAGGQLALMRDGGSLMCMDTDVDLTASQHDMDRAIAAVKARVTEADWLVAGIGNEHVMRSWGRAVDMMGATARVVKVGARSPGADVTVPDVVDAIPGGHIAADSGVEIYFTLVGDTGERWDTQRPGGGIYPLRECPWYNRMIPCADMSRDIVKRAFKKSWMFPVRSPVITGMYGLHWHDTSELLGL